MDITTPVTDYIRRSLLTTQGDIIVRGAAQPERHIQPCIFWAYGSSGGQAIADTAWVTLDLDTAIINRETVFNTTNNRFYAPRAGVYLLAYNVLLSSPITDGLYLFCRMIGSTIGTIGSMKNTAGAVDSFGLCCMTIATLALNEYVYVQVYQDSGAAETIDGGNCYFCGVELI